MKTPTKKSPRGSGGGGEMSLRLRESRKEEKETKTENDSQTDEDMESELPIRGRPSKKLLLQQQQQQRVQTTYQVKLQPELKTVQAAAGAAGTGGRSKAKRSLGKKAALVSAATQKLQNETYVMRLFERSLDLSKYKDKTPLYPICRAWMANQPRNPSVTSYNTEGSVPNVKRENNGEEILAKLRSGDIKVLTQLPQARRTKLSMIPPRLEFKDDDDQGQPVEGSSREELLSANLHRWKKVRGHWLKHAQKYEHERYEVIDQIMDIVCKNSILT